MTSSGSTFIREATLADCPQICGLIEELNKHQGLPNSPHVSTRALEEHGFRDHPLFKCLVAVDISGRASSHDSSDNGASDATSSDAVVGYVLFWYGFGREGKHVNMEDLYVTPAHRSKGLGTELWRTILKLGLEAGAQSCRFCVYDWNAPSIAFYENRGALDTTANKGFHFFGMTRDVVEKFVARKANSIEGVAILRAAKKTDVNDILTMQQQLDARLGEQGKRLTEEELHEAIFSSFPSSHIVVAEDHRGLLLGYVLFSLCFTTWQGFCFEVCEIYVKADSRRLGVGSHLLQHVMKHCLSLGCLRCDFLTAPDSVLVSIMEEIDAVDHTKEEGWLLMFMDKAAMVRMVDSDGKKPSQQ